MKDSLLVRVFGKSPRVKVLGFLLNNSELDWSKSEIARKAGISRATLDRFFESLVKDRMILANRAIGRARMFKLNKQVPLVRKLLEMDRRLGASLDSFLGKAKCRKGIHNEQRGE